MKMIDEFRQRLNQPGVVVVEKDHVSGGGVAAGGKYFFARILLEIIAVHRPQRNFHLPPRSEKKQWEREASIRRTEQAAAAAASVFDDPFRARDVGPQSKKIGVRPPLMDPAMAGALMAFK